VYEFIKYIGLGSSTIGLNVVSDVSSMIVFTRSV